MHSKSLTRQCTVGDPKFWPSLIKYAVLLNLSLFVFLGNMYSSGIATGFPELAMDFRVSFGKLTDLIAWSVLALGVSSIFWMPIALCIGKRPVTIASLIVFLAGSLWSQYATSFDSLLGSRVLASLGAGAVETLGPSMVAGEYLFLERKYATAMAFLQMFLAGGSQIGPLIAGYLIEARGWHWFFKLTSILIGINLFSVIFFLLETTYRRNVADGQIGSEQSPGFVSDKAEDVEIIETVTRTNDPSGAELNTPYAGSYWTDLIQFHDRGLEQQGIRAVFRRAIEPLQFFAVPQVVYAGASFGTVIGGIVVISSLSPALLSPPPYLFTSALSVHLEGTRGSGEHQPEHRMPALVLPFLICPPGLILYAYTIAAKRSYAIAGVGFAMQSAGLVLVPSVLLAYAVDTYPRRSGEALVLINAIKNSVAFALTKSTGKWFYNEGLKKMFVEMAAVQWAILFLALPLYFASPWLRKKTLRFL
ncbi:related to MFS transporter [Phialocephala subalpina]|uniref:Related to MFS transporter n=1 Tax=Phialocephala subalpina TaxID=576137 RepID=A0A1L7XST9_9HELO|nr:related to MFS transporter [Phialocephala subalpina]